MTAPAQADWRSAVAPYVGADVRRSLLQIVTTIGPLAVAFWALYQAPQQPWLWLLVPVAAGLLVRTFIIMHDCAHGSFLPWRQANEVIGFITGVLTLTPFDQWRRDHALHHASSGDLDRRGHGDVPTLTVREYLAKSPSGRRAYRLVRHPLLLLLGGPPYLAFNQRFRAKTSKATKDKQVASVWWTNVAIVLTAAAAVWAWGWLALLIYLPVYYVAAAAGVWLFYVQHQFEDAYWESHQDWDYATAALRGSSHLRLNPVLRWFTGNIGLHHVHHLAPKIPNYRLQECHDSAELFKQAPEITPLSGMAALRLALWDEDRKRLVRFDEVDEAATIPAPVETTTGATQAA